MEPLVSIIVPLFNAEKSVSRCIDSLICQTYKNIEIILIDDGSEDSTSSICETYKKRDSRIMVAHQKNLGVSAARNTGLTLMKGEWFSFVDSDDFVTPNYISRLYHTAVDCNTYIAICRYSYFSINDVKTNSFNNMNTIPQIIDVSKYEFGTDYSHYAVTGGIFNRVILGDTRFQTDLYFGEDTLFFSELLIKLQYISYIEDNLYCCVVNKTSLSHGSVDEKKYSRILAWERICKLFHGTKTYNSSRAALGFAALDFVARMVKDEDTDSVLFKRLVKTMRGGVLQMLLSRTPLNDKKYYLYNAISPVGYYRLYNILKDRKK